VGGARNRGAAAFAVLLGLALPALAQRQEPPPKELEGVGITEHLGTRLPLDLNFTDEEGKSIPFRSFFNQGRPVILTLNYYTCPMLCTLILNGLVDGLKGLSLSPGADFELVTISINPKESPRLAVLKKQNYVKEYERPTAAAWHFLTSPDDQVKRLSEAVGFLYKYDARQEQYIHAAAIFVLTADGRISRYLYGVTYDPQTLRLALVEASQGKMGSSLDRFILYCYHYDKDNGRFALSPMALVRFGGVLTALFLVLFLTVLWRRERRKRTAGAAND
jgi:protein SCO1